MKFRTVLAIALVTALSKAKVVSNFANERVRQTKSRLEKVYGPGLLGLRHEETGKIVHERWEWARTIPGATYMEIGGFKIDSNSGLSSIMGFADGLQYKSVAKYN